MTWEENEKEVQPASPDNFFKEFYSGGNQRNRAIFGRGNGDKRDVLFICLKIYIK